MNSDERLLRELAGVFAGRAFDVVSIGYQAGQRPELGELLVHLGCGRRRGDGRLTDGAHRRLTQWLSRMDGREIAGLRLERGERGWCRIVKGGRA
jgi:hypothetical protein